MTHEELQKAIYLNELIKESGFKLERDIYGIALRADTEHENLKAFRFVKDNQLGFFETVEEIGAFVAGWRQCMSMMELTGQTK